MENQWKTNGKSIENQWKMNGNCTKSRDICPGDICPGDICPGVDYSTRAKRGRFFCFLIDFWYVFLLFGCLFELEAMENPLKNPLKFSRFNAKSTARRRKIVRAENRDALISLCKHRKTL